MPTRKRGQSLRADAMHEQRAEIALQLLFEGKSYTEIAALAGYSDRSAAWKACRRLLRRRERANVEDAATLADARLDVLLSSFWKDALAGDPQAGALALRIEESRRKLLGTDAPTRAAENAAGQSRLIVIRVPDELMPQALELPLPALPEGAREYGSNDLVQMIPESVWGAI